MINVGKKISNEGYREILNDVEGLGTAATRQNFPKELLKDGYIFEKNKYLISCEKSVYLY